MQRPRGIVVTTWLVGLMNLLGIFIVVWLVPDDQELAAGVVVAALGIGAVLCYWKGMDWGRWIVLLEALLCVWNVKYVGRDDATPTDISLMIVESLLAIFFLIYLNRKPVRAWFESAS
ncbi:hypothetical protein [Alloacidobacterium sp.]|uniref:hypothetical protein n=1 Tax=Alloacidobacterium sp. TaxID=2951999 RepID=UPI002D5B8D15|nr:hypothetical protein [Alloacidobacterium sp.]HYK34875.1 hypothetical protein [Alloacidobacterium sp.]